MSTLGVVLIGRNEGERLQRALQAVCGRGLEVVYVDSGSSDQSVAFARSVNAEVVELELAAGERFTAARARAAGVKRLVARSPDVQYIQFIDGDCQIVPGWLETAQAVLKRYSDVAAVCGRRREREPQRSVFNRFIDLEWDTPVGEARSCGGDAMYRVTAYEAAGGFDPTVAAGEEPELCRRLRREGWRVLRLDAEMTLHDADMTQFSQWWRREVRSGYGGLDVYRRTRLEDTLFGDQVRRTRVWSLGVLVAALVLGLLGGCMLGPWGAALGLLCVGALHAVQWIRENRRFRGRGASPPDARCFAALSLIGKWPQMCGQARWWLHRLRGRGVSIVEYKRTGSAPQSSPVVDGLRGDR